MSGWIGVDLDGTLAHYTGWQGPDTIGAPIPAMVDRVKKWLENGREVRIFTARAWLPVEATEAMRQEHVWTLRAITEWCKAHIGHELPITCSKDYGMIELWDDRCVQVVLNEGVPVASCKDRKRKVKVMEKLKDSHNEAKI